MSSFQCLICKTNIIEGKDGRYITGCKHYPIEHYKLNNSKTIFDFFNELEKIKQGGKK